MPNQSYLHQCLLISALIASCCSCQSAFNATEPSLPSVSGSVNSVPAVAPIEEAITPRQIVHHGRPIRQAIMLPNSEAEGSQVVQISAIEPVNDAPLNQATTTATPVRSPAIAPIAASAQTQTQTPSDTTSNRATLWLNDTDPASEQTSEAAFIVELSGENPNVVDVSEGIGDSSYPIEGSCSIDGTCIIEGQPMTSGCPVDPVDLGWAEGCQMLPGETPLHLADEYLCDGGDRETRVRVSPDWKVSGLDLEDTIAHFDTLDGRVVVTPSNSVCIYAPRFAAIRKVVQTSEDGLALLMQEVDTPAPPTTSLAINEAIKIHQPLMPGRDDGLHAAIGLRHRVRGLDQLHALRVAELAKDFQTYEDLQVIHTGIHRGSERALLEQWSQAAIAWDETVGPEVILDGNPAAVDTTIEKTATIHHVGLEGSPRLRVIKLASTRSAQPGEEVMFTLRFDNVGEQTIGNVTIMDNLTTRLEYVPESAECSLDAEFYSDPNQGDSLALRWEIKEPIKPGDGGIIRFRCKVR